MKLTIEDNNGEVTELVLADLPGDHSPLLRRALHEIKNGRVPRTSRLIKDVKCIKKGKTK